MPKQADAKLTEFIKLFQREADSDRLDTTTKGNKIQTLRLYLQNDEYLISFNECLGLYKIVLEQDKVFQFRQKKNWHKEEVQVLIYMVCQFYFWDLLDIEKIQDDTWGRLSLFFTGRSADDCKFKWLSISKHPVNSCTWDPEEQTLLRQILTEVDYDNQRPRWNKVAKIFNTRSHRNSYIFRTSKELKKKWVSSICPLQRGLWRKEEDLILFESVRDHGKKWSYISKLMKELRTQNGVKNRFLSVIDKEVNSCMSKKKIVVSEEELILRIIRKIKASLGTPEKKPDEDEVKTSKTAEKNILDGDPDLPQSQHENDPPQFSQQHQHLQLQNSHQFQYLVQPVYCPIIGNVVSPAPVFVPVVLNWGYMGQTPQPTPIIQGTIH